VSNWWPWPEFKATTFIEGYNDDWKRRKNRRYKVLKSGVHVADVFAPTDLEAMAFAKTFFNPLGWPVEVERASGVGKGRGGGLPRGPKIKSNNGVAEVEDRIMAEQTGICDDVLDTGTHGSGFDVMQS
jgi:hypothetical protein